MASEEAIDFRLETSTAYRQFAMEPSRLFRDLWSLRLTEYMHLHRYLDDQIGELARMAYLMEDLELMLVVVEELMVER